MADQAETKNVFLDTDVYFQLHRNFSSYLMRIVVRLASNGDLKLFLTTVTRDEIKSDLDADAKALTAQIKSFRRKFRVGTKILPSKTLTPLFALTEESIKKGLHGEFDQFIADADATVIPIKDVSPDRIFVQYFKRQAPFGSGDKKAEFPDAFAFAALRKWCKKKGERMYVVSNDGDWKRACKGKSEMIHVPQLFSLLELFADSVIVTGIKEALRENNSKLIQKILIAAEDLDFFVDDSVPDGEVSHIDSIGVEIEETHVVEANASSAVVNLTCSVTADLYVSASDPDTGIYDQEVGDMHYVFTMSGSIRREKERTVVVKLTFDRQKPEKAVIKSVDFEDRSFPITIESGELSQDNDGDDEYDPGYEPDNEPEPDYEPDIEPPPEVY